MARFRHSEPRTSETPSAEDGRSVRRTGSGQYALPIVANCHKPAEGRSSSRFPFKSFPVKIPATRLYVRDLFAFVKYFTGH